MKQQVLLTRSLFLCEKMEAHERGLQHYAFSIIIINDNGDMLLQKRAYSKYHCGGLWSNACCGHPLSVDTIKDIEQAAFIRLQEEMGISISLRHLFTFEYLEKCGDLTENEIDYVFIGKYNNSAILPNPKEVVDYRWKSIGEIIRDIESYPQKYTPWFRILTSQLMANYNKYKLKNN